LFSSRKGFCTAPFGLRSILTLADGLLFYKNLHSLFQLATLALFPLNPNARGASFPSPQLPKNWLCFFFPFHPVVMWAHFRPCQLTLEGFPLPAFLFPFTSVWVHRPSPTAGPFHKRKDGVLQILLGRPSEVSPRSPFHLLVLGRQFNAVSPPAPQSKFTPLPASTVASPRIFSCLPKISFLGPIICIWCGRRYYGPLSALFSPAVATDGSVVHPPPFPLRFPAFQ